MNVLIIGFGTAGKHYFDLLKKNKNVKNIYVLDDAKLPKNKKYFQVSKKKFKIKIYKSDMRLFVRPQIFITHMQKFV